MDSRPHRDDRHDMPILALIKRKEDIRVGEFVVNLPGEFPMDRTAVHIQHDVGHHSIQHQQGQHRRAGHGLHHHGRHPGPAGTGVVGLGGHPAETPERDPDAGGEEREGGYRREAHPGEQPAALAQRGAGPGCGLHDGRGACEGPEGG